MVKETKYNNQKYFYCEICKLVYKDRIYAKKCEDWCRKYKSCNLKITKYAIK